jgi:hypothetical protein
VLDVYGHEHEEELKKIRDERLEASPDMECIAMWNTVLKERWDGLTQKEQEHYQDIAMKNYRSDLAAWEERMTWKHTAEHYTR